MDRRPRPTRGGTGTPADPARAERPGRPTRAVRSVALRGDGRARPEHPRGRAPFRASRPDPRTRMAALAGGRPDTRRPAHAAESATGGSTQASNLEALEALEELGEARTPEPAKQARVGARPEPHVDRRPEARASARTSRRRRREVRRASRREDRRRYRAEHPVRPRSLALGGICIAAVIGSGVFLKLQPMEQVDRQHRTRAASEARVTRLDEEIERLDHEIAEARTDAAIRAEARKLVMSAPGEELVIVLPQPVEPLGLPETWPFTGVQREIETG